MAATPIARVEEIPRLGARVLETRGVRIAVFRSGDDRIFALEDRCPHRGGPLSQGIVHGHCVTCPLHDWVIDLATGEATGADEGRTETIPVHIVDDRVCVDLDVVASLASRGGADESEARSAARVASPIDGAVGSTAPAPDSAINDTAAVAGE